MSKSLLSLDDLPPPEDGDIVLGKISFFAVFGYLEGIGLIQGISVDKNTLLPDLPAGQKPTDEALIQLGSAIRHGVALVGNPALMAEEIKQILCTPRNP